jgi:hypothetical protein
MWAGQHCPFARLLPLPLPVFRSLPTGDGEWLKSLHKKPRLPGQIEPLYRDVRLSVALFSMVLCDDPFEVKLRDNYELRED